MLSVSALIALPIVHSVAKGAALGILVAARTDYQAFATWKDFHDASVYQWSTASWRWFQGAITGGIGAALMSYGLSFTS